MDFHSGEPAALVEFNLSVAVSVGSRALGRPSALTEVWFTHPAPADVRHHRAAFGAPLRFDAPYNALISPAAQYREPLRGANPLGLENVLRQARAMLDALPSYTSFADQVRGQIRDTLPKGNTNASAIAEDLGMSARTLHRRLQGEGVSYQELLDQVRLDIATGHLVTGRHSIVAIAERVGFSQPSTFHRAFKSWTGLTPAEYQQRHAGHDARPRRDEPPQE
jgi:AraC-like DNA-binding protein